MKERILKDLWISRVSKLLALALTLLGFATLEAADIPPAGVDLVDLTSPAGPAFSIKYEWAGKVWLENCDYRKAFDDGIAYDRTDRVIIQKTELDIGFEFGVATNVNAYSIILPNTTDSVAARAPKIWEFQGSNDKATWEILDSRAEENWKTHERRFFKFNNDKEFKYYRLYVKSVNGDSYFQISELEFYHIKEEYRPPVVDEPDTSVYERHIEITVAGVPVGTELANFPVLVRLSSETIAGFRLSDVKRSGHGDIVFVDSQGKYMPHEIDTWNEADGVALVWVKLGLLKQGEKFFMYYGNEDADAGNEVCRVWSGYAGVWHFSNGYMFDSTGQNLLSRLDKSAQIFSCGMIGGGITNGVAYSAHPFGNIGSIGKFSVSGWVNPNDNSATARIFSTKASAGDNGFELIYVAHEKGRYVYLRGNGSDLTLSHAVSSADTIMPLNTWMHYAGVFNGDLGAVYTNGAELAAGNISPVTEIRSDYLAFGGSVSGVDLIQGAYDELRVYNGIPPEGWLQAEYESVSREDYLTYSPVVARDATVPLVGIPLINRNADGSFSITVDVSAGTGDVSAVLSNGVEVVSVKLSTTDEDFPKKYTGVVSGLAADRTYHTYAVGTGETGMVDVSKGSSVYSGALAVEAGGNAAENGLLSGSFVFSRADTEGDLEVWYLVSGTAVHGTTFEYLPGKTVIPDGERSVVVSVVPKVHALLNEDTLVILTITDGLYGIPAEKSAQITVENLVLDDTYNYWIAPVSGKASVASNWSRGVPVETDCIVLDGRITVAECEWDAGVNNLPASVASWRQEETYTGRVIIPTKRTGDFTCFTVTGDAVLNGGEWWRPENLKADGNDAKVWLNISVGGDLKAGSDFIFNGAAAGYPKQCGYSFGGDGTSRGASHGGLGAANGNPYGGGTVYGDYKNPVTLGSGDYNSQIGGGSVVLNIDGDFILEGKVTANAQNASQGGGTSGGSVWIRATAMSGAGSVLAEGGSPVNKIRPGGGGGRISIQLSKPGLTFEEFKKSFTGEVSAAGGFSTNSSTPKSPGGAGTVYIETAADADKGVMIVKNKEWKNATHGPVTPIGANIVWNVSALVLETNGRVSVRETGILQIPRFSAIIGDGSESALLQFNGGTVSSDIKHDKLIADGFDVENLGTSSFAEHTLVIPDGSSLKIGGDFTVGALIMGRTRIAAGDYTAAELGAVYGNVSGDGVVHVLGLTDGFAITVR